MGRDHEESFFAFVRTVPFTLRGEAMEGYDQRRDMISPSVLKHHSALGPYFFHFCVLSIRGINCSLG